MGDGAERENASQVSLATRLLETHLSNELDKVEGLKDDQILVWAVCTSIVSCPRKDGTSTSFSTSQGTVLFRRHFSKCDSTVHA